MSEEVLQSFGHVIDGEMIPISRRLVAPEKFTNWVESSDSINLPAKVSLDCRWSSSAKKYLIERLVLQPREDGSQLTSHLIRKVQLGALLESATRTHLILYARVVTPDGTRSTTKALDEFEELADRLKQAGPSSSETLEWVSLLYEIAATEGPKPTQMVSEGFGISIRTASNWVRMAREQGMLDDG